MTHRPHKDDTLEFPAIDLSLRPKTRLDRCYAIAVVLIVIAFAALTQVDVASAKQEPWTRATATFYGPGFYGNRTACGQTYTTRIQGTAHMSLPCGAKLTVCKYVGRRGLRRCLRITVIDRGAFHPNNLDLSARTAQDLCRCARPYTTPVMYRRGWKR